MLAWKVAGYYGLDRYLLPMLGRAVACDDAHHPTAAGACPWMTRGGQT